MDEQNIVQPGPTRVVRLTPPGRGAVATLLVAGHDAVAMVDRLFRGRAGRRLGECSTDQIIVGRCIEDSQQVGEEIVARRASDEEVFLHSHGGTAAVERLEALLTEHGAVAQDWTAWAADAREDRLQAEALEALSKATTPVTAGILLDQYQGALRRKLNEISTVIANGNTETAGRELDRLIDRARLGLHLTEPWKVVLAGQPNTGKSSLLNALVGYQRAIVHATAGTTRDMLSANTSVDGWPVELIDTAGLREGDDSVESEGVRRAQLHMASADLVLLVFDASQAFTKQDRLLLDDARKLVHNDVLESIAKPDQPHRVPGNEHSEDPVFQRSGPPLRFGPGTPHKVLKYPLIVHNKSDLPAAPGSRPEGIATSALTVRGIDDLLHAIAERLVPNPPSPTESIPWTHRQIDHLTAMRAALVK